MTDLELIFSMLGEAATTEITRTRDAQGFPESKHAACQILTAGLPRYLQFQPRLQLGQSPRFRG